MDDIDLDQVRQELLTTAEQMRRVLLQSAEMIKASASNLERLQQNIEEIRQANISLAHGLEKHAETLTPGGGNE